MIDFACKQIELSEVIKCSFNLNKTDYKILAKLVGNEKYLSIVEISRIAGFERSTVQKSIKKLLGQGLIRRTQINMSKGGYVFKYKVKDKGVIKQKINRLVDSWSERAKREVMTW